MVTKNKHMLSDDLAFEVKCRTILLKRLEPPLTALTRMVEKENATRLTRAQELSVYQSEQEAHDAYGYGYITFAEYEAIKRRFEDTQLAAETPTTPNSAAMSILKDFVGRLQSEIRHFEWEALPNEEKQRIEGENAAVRDRVMKRRQGVVT